MSKRKILGITGIRSEYEISHPVFNALNQHKNIDFELVASGAHLSSLHNYTIKDIKKGEKFNKHNIRSYRPKIWVGSEYFESLIGKKSKKNISKFTPIFKNVF